MGLPEDVKQQAIVVPKVSSDEFNVLTVLRRANGGKKLSAREIGPAIDVSSHSVGRLARRLVEAGFVNRTQPFKGAAFRYELTDEARKQFFAEVTAQ